MLQDRLAIGMLVAILFLQVAQWAYDIWQVRPQETPVFLHYNIYFGVDLIGPWYQFFLMPAIGLVIAVVNVLLARIVFRRQKIFGYIILGITLVYQVLIFLASYLIIMEQQRII